MISPSKFVGHLSALFLIYYNAMHVHMFSCSESQLFATPWTVARQVSLFMGFPRQKYWSGLPFPSPGDLPDPGIEPRSPASLQVILYNPGFFTIKTPGKPLSAQFSHSVVSNSLRPHGLQHARLLCPSSTLGAYSNSCPLSWWCHPTISSSVIPFSSCLQCFPALGSFQMSQFFP